MKTRIYYGTNRNAIVRKGKVTFDSATPDDAEDLRFGHMSFQIGSVPDEAAALEERLERSKTATIARYTENSKTGKLGSITFFQRLHARMKKGHTTVVYLHGYSESFRSAMGTTGMFTQFLHADGQKALNGVLFSWPSDGKKTPWKAYRDDRVDARASGPALGRAILKLRDYLREISTEQGCNARLVLICHSMGNFALQNALVHIGALEGPVLPQIFDEVLMLAPDVDADALERPDKLGRLTELSRRITVYTHAEDKALWLSRSTKGNPDRLGLSGLRNSAATPDSVDVVDCTRIDTGLSAHAYYAEPKVLADMRAVISGETYDIFEGKRRWEPGRNRWVLL